MEQEQLVGYKFEKLQVWEIALDLSDLIYSIAAKLPDIENHNLKVQIRRASISICLNIAEGSTGLSDREQSRFLKMSLRSLIETIACVRIIIRRKYVDPKGEDVLGFDKLANIMFIKLNTFIKTLNRK